ncbi:MAG: TetR/AcrR family transcriptional regulator [Fimbriimonadaceae bacterium]|nr:TetR/AcrR family transcriptional regulator [Fimbriimonadaceae bacterium]
MLGVTHEHEQTTERIIRAATGLFADLGYEPVSIREIAGVAGVHFSVINYHFGSKRNLYIACLESAACNSRFNSLIDEFGTEPNPEDFVRAIALIMLQDGESEGFTDGCRLVSRDMASQNPNYPVIDRHWRAGFSLVAKAFGRLRGGDGTEPEAKMAAACFFSMVDNLIHFRSFARSELMSEMSEMLTNEWVADQVVQIFLRGVCSPEPQQVSCS